jgi:hypothetical protein
VLKKTLAVFVLLTVIAWAPGCTYGGVEVDPRDKEAADEYVKAVDTMVVLIQNDHFGPVKVSIVGSGGGMRRTLGTFTNGSHGEDGKIRFSKNTWPAGQISILLEPTGASGRVYRMQDRPPRGEYRFLYENVWYGSMTRYLYIDIKNVLHNSSVTWY